MHGCYTQLYDKFLLTNNNDRIIGQRNYSGRQGGRPTKEFLSNGKYLFWVASEAANQGEHKKALDYLEQVLTTNPNHAMAWHVQGNCLDCLGQYEEAVRSYDISLKLDPGNADTLFDKGLTLKKLGREIDSQYCMEMAVKIALGD